MSTTVETQRVYDELTWLRQAVETLTQKVEGLAAGYRHQVFANSGWIAGV